MASLDPDASLSCIVLRAGGRTIALPMADVVEVARAQPIQAVSGAPSFVLGVAVLRGAALPVVSLARLLGEDVDETARLVTIRSGERRVALAAAEVLGARSIPRARLESAPPLLRGVASDAIVALATRDDALLTVLGAAAIVDHPAVAAVVGEGA